MNKPNDDDRDRLQEVIRQHISQLSEHFENVQVFASNREEGGQYTSGFVHGCGNWHARLGHVKEWVIYNDEIVRRKAGRDADEDED